MQQQRERVRDKALRRPRFKIEHLQVHQEGTKKKKKCLGFKLENHYVNDRT